MKTIELKYIKCPICGAEYLPAEIFLPNSIIGKPTDIEKSEFGKIVYYSDTQYDTAETYICDYCNKAFKVRSRLSFEVEKDSKNDFTEDYCTELPRQISLDELYDTNS